jgi:hypothetical protein
MVMIVGAIVVIAFLWCCLRKRMNGKAAAGDGGEGEVANVENGGLLPGKAEEKKVYVL